MKPWPEAVSWKVYFTVAFDTLIGFSIATFSLGMYIIHGGIHSYISLALMLVLYIFIIGLLIRRIVEKFSLAALMLLIPIAPLLVLILIISLIPLLQILK